MNPLTRFHPSNFSLLIFPIFQEFPSFQCLAFSSFRCVSKPCPPAIFCSVSAPLFCLQCLSVATQQCPAFFLQHLFSATLLHCFSSNIYLPVFSYNDLWCLLIFFYLSLSLISMIFSPAVSLLRFLTSLLPSVIFPQCPSFEVFR